MNDVLKRIMSVGTDEIDSILWAAIQRKRELYPNWHFIYVSLPKDNVQERKVIIHDLICQLNKEAEEKQSNENVSLGC